MGDSHGGVVLLGELLIDFLGGNRSAPLGGQHIHIQPLALTDLDEAVAEEAVADQ